MQKILIRLVLSILTIFLFTGCGKPLSLAIPPVAQNCAKVPGINAACNIPKDRMVSVEKDLYHILATGDSALGNHTMWTNATITALQTAAVGTIQMGYNYFAIKAPAKISNFAGNTMNTAEEYVKECSTSMAQLIYQRDPCEVHSRGSKRVGDLLVKMYVVQPVEVVTYDAKAVIEYLKKEELYFEDGDIKMKQYIRDAWTEFSFDEI